MGEVRFEHRAGVYALGSLIAHEAPSTNGLEGAELRSWLDFGHAVGEQGAGRANTRFGVPPVAPVAMRSDGRAWGEQLAGKDRGQGGLAHFAALPTAPKGSQSEPRGLPLSRQ